MKIEIGKYTVYSDAYNLWITERRKAKQKKGKQEADAAKEIEVRVSGYAANFEQLMTQFFDNTLRGSDAKTTAQLLNDVKAARDEVKMLTDGLRREGRLA